MFSPKDRRVATYKEIFVRPYCAFEGIDFWNKHYVVRFNGHPMEVAMGTYKDEIRPQVQKKAKMFDTSDQKFTIVTIPDVKTGIAMSDEPPWIVSKALEGYMKVGMKTRLFGRDDRQKFMKQMNAKYKEEMFFQYSHNPNLYALQLDNMRAFPYNTPHDPPMDELLDPRWRMSSVNAPSIQVLKRHGKGPDYQKSVGPYYLDGQYTMEEHISKDGYRNILVHEDEEIKGIDKRIRELFRKCPPDRSKCLEHKFPESSFVEFVQVDWSPFPEDENKILREFCDFLESLLSDHLQKKRGEAREQKSRSDSQKLNIEEKALYFGNGAFYPQSADAQIIEIRAKAKNIIIMEHKNKIDKLLGFIHTFTDEATPLLIRKLLGYRKCRYSSNVRNGFYTIRYNGTLDTCIHWIVYQKEYWDVTDGPEFLLCKSTEGVYFFESSGNHVKAESQHYTLVGKDLVASEGLSRDDGANMATRVSVEEYKEMRAAPVKYIKTYKRAVYGNEILKINMHNIAYGERKYARGTVRIQGLKEICLFRRI